MVKDRFSLLGFKDHHHGKSAKFKKLKGCTPFGNKIAIADLDNNAVRSLDVDSSAVESIIKRGASGSPDGAYTASSSSGGGVSLPLFIESLNDTHLIVVQRTSGLVRVIDTVNKIITTLVDLGDNVGLYSLSGYDTTINCFSSFI